MWTLKKWEKNCLNTQNRVKCSSSDRRHFRTRFAENNFSNQKFSIILLPLNLVNIFIEIMKKTTLAFTLLLPYKNVRSQVTTICCQNTKIKPFLTAARAHFSGKKLNENLFKLSFFSFGWVVLHHSTHSAHAAHSTRWNGRFFFGNIGDYCFGSG